MRSRRGGRGHGNDVQTVVEISPELPGCDHLVKQAVGGGHDTGVKGLGSLAAQSAEGLFFQDTQEIHLVCRRDFADFVQKERTVRCHLEAALALPLGTGKGTGLVAKKFVGEELTFEHAAIDGHERFLTPPRELVHQTGKELLARARLTVNKNGRIGTGHLRGQPVQIPHGQGLDDELALAVLCTKLKHLGLTPG